MLPSADLRAINLLTDPESDLVVSVTSYERVLRRTHLFAAGEVRCPPAHPLFRTGGGPQTCPYIDFMRSTVIRATDHHRPTVLTANFANFQNIGSCYERRELDERGDCNDWIAISPTLLEELGGDRALSSKAADGIFFDKPIAPITANQYIAQRHLFELLNSDKFVSDLEFDEYSARLVQSILRHADVYWETRTGPQNGRRLNCKSQQRTLVETVKEKIAREYWANHSLMDLARSVHCSASKLVRIFPIETGFSMHAYQQHMRLRISLQLLRDGCFDISDVAAQLGFASHSHFTTAFHRQFGITPSEFVRSKTRGLMKHLVEALDLTSVPRLQ